MIRIRVNLELWKSTELKLSLWVENGILNSLNGLRLSARGHAEINMSQNYFVRRIIMRNFLLRDKKAYLQNNFSDSYLVCNRLCHELYGTHKIKFLKQAPGAPVINLCFWIKWKVYWLNWTRGKTIKQVLFLCFLYCT